MKLASQLGVKGGINKIKEWVKKHESNDGGSGGQGSQSRQGLGSPFSHVA